jgi:hypothetical protein
LNNGLWDQLIAVAEEGQGVRTELAADGSLFDGYYQTMQSAYARNLTRLMCDVIVDGSENVSGRGSRDAAAPPSEAVGSHPTLP